MHKKWCGKDCSECQTSCALDESMPCSPDCEFLGKDGDVVDYHNCLKSGCDAKTVDLIIQAISKEVDIFRREIKNMDGAEVYDKAYEINLVEEMVYAIFESPNVYEDNEKIIKVLTKLCKNGCFLSEYLQWAINSDSVNVSNLDETLNELGCFCNFYLETEE